MKNRLALSIFVSIIYIVLIEMSYVFNISSFSFSKMFTFINNNYFKYILIFVSTVVFYYVCSYILSPILRRIKDVKIYFILGAIIYVIHNLILKIIGKIHLYSSLQEQISLFLVIIFTTTTFFYSITYFNLVEY